jgi:steroid 5-alpha reductase family enzyme
MGLWQVYGIAAGAIFGLVTVLWLVSLRLKDASIVDVFWGAGFVVLSWLYFGLTPDGFPLRKWLISIFTTIWGLRLSLRILLRNWGKPEDYRYKKWREEAGEKWWWQSYYRVFLLQGFLLLIISAPLLAAQISPTLDWLTTLDIIAVAVWLVGFFFETVGDWQLDRFKAKEANQGKVLRTGLWRYTRHPNYFGDAVQWWAYYLIAIAAGGYWTFFSPIIMTELLTRVSGVKLLEETLTETKPGYREYVETTSPFVPWFPREPKGDRDELDQSSSRE